MKLYILTDMVNNIRTGGTTSPPPEALSGHVLASDFDMAATILKGEIKEDSYPSGTTEKGLRYVTIGIENQAGCRLYYLVESAQLGDDAATV